MDTDVLSFFDEHMDSLDFYEAFESSVRKEIKDVWIKVRKPKFHFITGTYLHVSHLQRFAGRKTVPPIILSLHLT